MHLNNSPLHCLLHADDVILLSDSAKGLQCSLDKLYAHCKKWKLTVNIHKTNIMIFNKSGKLITRYMHFIMVIHL